MFPDDSDMPDNQHSWESIWRASLDAPPPIPADNSFGAVQPPLEVGPETHRIMFFHVPVGANWPMYRSAAPQLARALNAAGGVTLAPRSNYFGYAPNSQVAGEVFALRWSSTPMDAALTLLPETDNWTKIFLLQRTFDTLFREHNTDPHQLVTTTIERGRLNMVWQPIFQQSELMPNALLADAAEIMDCDPFIIRQRIQGAYGVSLIDFSTKLKEQEQFSYDISRGEEA